jgi:hypothetical protein
MIVATVKIKSNAAKKETSQENLRYIPLPEVVFMINIRE